MILQKFSKTITIPPSESPLRILKLIEVQERLEKTTALPQPFSPQASNKQLSIEDEPAFISRELGPRCQHAAIHLIRLPQHVYHAGTHEIKYQTTPVNSAPNKLDS